MVSVCELMEGRSLEQCKEQWVKFEDINHPIKRGKWEPHEDQVSSHCRSGVIYVHVRILFTYIVHEFSELSLAVTRFLLL